LVHRINHQLVLRIENESDALALKFVSQLVLDDAALQMRFGYCRRWPTGQANGW
jgi:hypothetical protein